MLASVPGSEVVPFGKYRGQSIEHLLADRGYCEWLAAQPWFRDRFAPVYNIIIGAKSESQDTPEHNAMQARYLDHDEALRLVTSWLTSEEDALAQWRHSYEPLDLVQQANLLAGDYRVAISSLTFEERGWDVYIKADAGIPVLEVSDPPKDWCSPRMPYTPYEKAAFGISSKVSVTVELKPSLGDDYPTVLRTALRRPDGGERVVLADRAEFSGVTLGQVRKVFASQGVTLLITSELAPSLSCSCAECLTL